MRHFLISKYQIEIYIQESFLSQKNEDVVKKQRNDLKTIHKWQQINNMQFNEKKFELLRYGKIMIFKTPPHPLYQTAEKLNKPNVSKILASK